MHLHTHVCCLSNQLITVEESPQTEIHWVHEPFSTDSPEIVRQIHLFDWPKHRSAQPLRRPGPYLAAILKASGSAFADLWRHVDLWGPTPQPSSTIPQPQQNNHCSCNLWAIVLLLNTIVGTEQVNYSLSFSTHRRLSPLLTINLWLAISHLQYCQHGFTCVSDGVYDFA